MSAKLKADVPIEIEIHPDYHRYCGKCEYKESGTCRLFWQKLLKYMEYMRCEKCIDAFGYPKVNKDEDE